MSNQTLQLPNRSVQPPSEGGSPTLVAIAVTMGLLTVVINLVYISSIRNEAARQSFTVYELSHSVEAGHKLNKAKDLIPRQIPNVFKESFGKYFIDDGINTYQGQSFLRPAEDKDLLTHQFFESNAESIDSKINPGKRAIALDINSRNTSGLLHSNMHIDLSANFASPDSKPRNIVIIEKLHVIVVGNNTDETAKARTNFSNITVEIDPDIADQLLTIQKFVGRDGFDVRVRNSNDEKTKYININPEVLRLVGLKQ